MDNITKYRSCFINCLSVSDEELDKSETLKDFSQWNSLAHLTLIAEIEDAFDVLFESDDILAFDSFNKGL